MSATSFSLHIGINHVDNNHYKGWDGKLQGCENDALFYHQLAQKEGCTISKLLLTSDAANIPNVANVLGFLDYSKEQLNEGDNLIITYSGHGGILEDKNNDEPDFQDETWCLYDRQFLDDELAYRFSKFRQGVNIFIISDSCHSGSISKRSKEEGEASTEDASSLEVAQEPRLKRFVPRDKLFATYKANLNVYEPLMRRPLIKDKDIAAAVLQLGACQDDEFAMEDGSNGLFTKAIMKILERNGDIGTYQELLIRSKRALTGIQRPNLVCYGNNHQQLIKIKPFGSSFIAGTRTMPDIFPQSGALIIEATSAGKKLSELKQFIISQTLAIPEKEDHVLYHCNCEPDEPGMFPWDLAYKQYWFLKSTGFPICNIEPQRPQVIKSVLNAALEEKAIDVEAEIKDLSDDDQLMLASVFQKLYKAMVKNKRGLGRANLQVEDEVLLKMFSLETVQVIFRDEDLALYRSMSPEKLGQHLAVPENYLAFTTIVKNSIFSSDTLTVHL